MNTGNITSDDNTRRRWKIRNRFVGFIVLLLLALICLISPKIVEYHFNSVGGKK